MATNSGIVGSLQVNVVAKTDKFISGLNSAATWAGRFGKRVGSVSGSIAKLATVGNLVQVAIAGAFGEMIHSAIEAGTEVFKLTKKLHISAEGVTALHFAAEQLGISTEAVDAGVFKLEKTLGAAINGSKEAAAAFGLLGLNYRDLQNKPVQQQFLTVIEALHNIPDVARRAALAQGIFGKASGDLASIIDDGTAKIIEQGQAAANLGVLMSGETAKSLDEAGSALGRLSAQWESLKNNVVGTFAPVITAITWLADKGLGILKTWFYIFRILILDIGILFSQMILGVVKGINLLLPKFAKIDTGAIQSFADSFSAERQAQGANLRDTTRSFLGSGNAENPLSTPQTTAAPVAQQANDTFSQMLAVMKQVRDHVDPNKPAGPPQLPQVAIAGVR